jgi:hypothetical protein
VSSHLDFLRNLQQLLDEGVFVATYKHALLQSIADLAIEKSADEDGSMRVWVLDLAEKFIYYYWRQSAPYRGSDGILKQNSGRQAAIVNYVAETRAEYLTLPSCRSDKEEWQSLRRRVANVIKTMPLWKLQVVPGGTNEFLYRKSEYEAGSIRLLPDAVRSLRDLYVIITNFIRGAWISQILSIGYNRDILGDVAALPEFLFGSERASLERYRKVLREFQLSRCFYCGREVRSGELDHFIPWSRYPVDLGHNFVYSHPNCNRAKRDFLADLHHLAKWNNDHLGNDGELDNALDRAGLIHDKLRSRHIAQWAYEQGEAARSHVWSDDGNLRLLGSRWRQILAA